MIIAPPSDFNHAVSEASSAISPGLIKTGIQIEQVVTPEAPLSARELERMHAVSALNETFEECSLQDWDDEGAAAVSPEVFLDANRLLVSLPSWVEIPDVGPEPNGSIGFEWHARPKWTFVVAVTGRQTLEYAGVFGTAVVHGTEIFVDAVPTSVLQNLRRLYA